MVQDQVDHELELTGKPFNVLPAAQVRIHLVVIDNRKTIIRTGREKRQDMDTGKGLRQIIPQEPVEGLQRPFIRPGHHVAIGYQQAALFVPVGSVPAALILEKIIAPGDQGETFQ